MKKTYLKPEIAFESFTLSTNIAGNCEQPFVTNSTKGVCAIESSGGVNIFSGTVALCDFLPEQMGGKEDEWDGFCYHVPTEDRNLFNS